MNDQERQSRNVFVSFRNKGQ